MYKQIIITTMISLLMVIGLTEAHSYEWIEDGIPVCDAANSQDNMDAISDGEGGMFLVWHDARSGQKIYAQHIDNRGNALWTAQGVEITIGDNFWDSPALTLDGAGGIYVVYQQIDEENWNIYAQRIDRDGIIQWSTAGVAICQESNDQTNVVVAADGYGGLLIAWQDLRSGTDSDIYTQRVDAAGATLWTIDGHLLTRDSADQTGPQIVANYTGGAIIGWMSQGTVDINIYAQYVNGSGTEHWSIGGVAVSPATVNQIGLVMAEDGAGGVIFAWDSSDQILAFRMNRYSNHLWGIHGSPVSVLNGSQNAPQIVSDGAHGAYVAMVERIIADYYIYVQHIFFDGSVWGANAIPVCGTTSPKSQISLARDGADGLLVSWQELRNLADYDIIAQRMNESNALEWGPDGVTVCGQVFDQEGAWLVPDGSGGALVAWMDNRIYTETDIYSQRIESNGYWGYPAPEISGVRDLPGDQGGFLNISWDASRLDLWPDELITEYSIWRAIDPMQAMMLIKSDPGLLLPTSEISAAPVNGGIRMEMLDGTAFYWNHILTVESSLYIDHYSEQVESTFDSTATSTEFQYFQVIAHGSEISQFWISEPDSGYSVDNIAPCAPVMLEGEQSFSPAGLQLTWTSIVEPDMGCYHVYRGLSEEFVPEPGNLIDSPCDTTTFDDSWTWDGGYYYKVAAVDIHGNESDYALFSPAELTGDDTPSTPQAAYLQQNYPNPFNPQTTIEFGLAEASPVSLNVYDAAGRLVRVILDETLPAAHYSEGWDGKDGSGKAVASGVYFYRLSTKTFSENRKMILLR